MNIRSILIASALIISPHLYASNFLKLTNEPLTINQCPITTTDDALDLAIMNDGYFVVSNGKPNAEKRFTRFGRMAIDSNNYLVHDSGHYLLAVNPNSDANHLSKIQIPMKNLAPKATTKVNFEINLDSTAVDGSNYVTSSTLYDSLGDRHLLKIKAEKVKLGHWQVSVLVDDIDRDTGTLIFNSSGMLIKQHGLSHVQWPADYGMHKLKIDFTNSTQFGAPFSLNLVRQDGYPMGILTGINLTWDGTFVLLYSNGKSKVLKNRIAVAQFTNPKYLEQLNGHLYRPTEKSGDPMIHWTNSEGSIMSGALEDAACLKG